MGQVGWEEEEDEPLPTSPCGGSRPLRPSATSPEYLKGHVLKDAVRPRPIWGRSITVCPVAR